MLDAIKKKLGMTPVTEEAKMKDEKPQASTPVVDNTAAMETLQASFDAQAEQLAALTSQLAAAQAEVESARAAVAEVEKAKAEAIAQAKAVKMAARNEKIVAALGTEKAPGLMAATEGLDDKAFEAVVSALAGSVEVEAKTELFNEIGVDAKAEVAVDEKPTHFNTFIKK